MRCLVLVLAWLVLSCGTSTKRDSDAVHEGAESELLLSKLPRAEFVARADKLVSLAERTTGSSRAAMLSDAGRLRESIWRLERRPPDALEAIELYAEAGKAGDCDARLRGAALKAEVDVAPGSANQALSAAGPANVSPQCELATRALRSVLGISNQGSGVRSKSVTETNVGSSEQPSSQIVVPNQVPIGPSGGAQVTRVERYGAKDSARIVVGVSQPTTFRAGLLAPEGGGVGSRLYIDIERASIDKSQTYAVGGLVQRIRLAGRDGGVRVVLDLEEAAERRIFYMPEPFRLIIDVARGANAGGLRAALPRVIERVVIDPGHGGHDPGAIGPRGLMEKDVTLDIAHRAAPLIAREVGLSTLLTRDTDTFVALDERTAKANAFRADLFVSIHCNAAERTGSDGVVTFVLDRTSDASASRIAAIENSASQAAASELAETLGPVQDEGILARSLHFAGLLQRSTVASLSKSYGTIPNQGVRRAGFYVLAGAHMPAVLYEVSFISNPDGEIRLNTADYRQRLADSVVNAVRAYRDGI